MTPVASSTITVAVLGGGVGGLSAAHELAERGYAVTVYERQAALGGKARSMPAPGTGTGGRKDLPGEHGFRFFPGFYKHITDTMRRIPFGAGGASCADNLVLATRMPLARAGRPDPIWITRLPETHDDFRTALLALFDDLDLPKHEIAFFVTRVLGLATSCEDRFHQEFEHVSFWDFIGARTRSENYRRYLGQGMTRSTASSSTCVAISRWHTATRSLLINHDGSLALRPEAHTEIGNLFLASDYVRTYTDLATMEAANEAARRATNAILAVSGVTAPPCGLWQFDIPKPMRDAQVLDKLRFRMGLPNLILSAK